MDLAPLLFSVVVFVESAGGTLLGVSLLRWTRIIGRLLTRSLFGLGQDAFRSELLLGTRSTWYQNKPFHLRRSSRSPLSMNGTAGPADDGQDE